MYSLQDCAELQVRLTLSGRFAKAFKSMLCYTQIVSHNHYKSFNLCSFMLTRFSRSGRWTCAHIFTNNIREWYSHYYWIFIIRWHLPIVWYNLCYKLIIIFTVFSNTLSVLLTQYVVFIDRRLNLFIGLLPQVSNRLRGFIRVICLFFGTYSEHFSIYNFTAINA